MTRDPMTDDLAPHVLFYSSAMGGNLCRYCGLAEDYLRKGSLDGGWPYGGRREVDGVWAPMCKYWPAFADRYKEIETQMQFQAGIR